MPDREHPQRQIDWSTAEVKDGGLIVALSGEPSGEWSERLDAVLGRLARPGSGWGAIEVHEERIEIGSVGEGREADLRHFLEGGVQQANADLARSEAQASESTEAESSAGSSPQDREMTEAFRAFAEDAREVEEQS